MQRCSDISVPTGIWYSEIPLQESTYTSQRTQYGKILNVEKILFQSFSHQLFVNNTTEGGQLLTLYRGQVLVRFFNLYQDIC